MVQRISFLMFGVFLAVGAASPCSAATPAEARAAVINVAADEAQASAPPKAASAKKVEKLIVDQIPAGVVATIKKEVPQGTIESAEKQTKKDKVSYSVTVKAPEASYVIKTDEAGKFVSKKIVDPTPPTAG